MSMRYPGGFITATAPTVNASSAKGIWTIEEAMQYVKAGTWPVPTGNGDPYFGYNTLLLPGQGTNGAQNNTFLDSSTNNFTITRNGNTTQGTFTPFSHASGYWSNYYNSTLTAWSEVLWTELSGISWTAEFWFYPVAQGGPLGGLIFGNNLSGRGDSCFIYHGSDGKVGVTTAGSTNFTSFGSTTSLPLNQWTHVAITISGSSGSATGKIYLNGVLDKTQTSMNTVINSMSSALTGSRGDGSQYNLYGYLSNFRIVKNQILYTGDFTPATAPLTTTSVGTSGANVAASITGTVSTLIYNNAILANSGATSASVNSNSASVQTFQPFGTPTSAYSAATIGGSGYFDGSGDYLTVADNASLEPGSSDFTIECWIYPTATGSYLGVFSKRTNNSTDYSPIQILINSGTMILAASTSGSGWAVNVNASSSPPLNAWSHIAVVRNGTASNNLVLYLNGVSVATGSVSSTALVNNAGAWAIGADSDDGGGNFAGYICGFRSVIGSAVYTSAFTPPTSPLTAITNTQLLLNYTNAGVIDNAVSNDLETVGGASISTTQYKWGTSSMYFDGTGDYVYAPTSPTIAFGTGDFTWEAWIYASSASDKPIYECRSTNSTTDGFTVTAYSSTVIRVFTNGVVVSATIPNYLNTWTHVAFVRAAGVAKLFINGLQYASAALTSNFTNTTAAVGAGRYGSSSIDTYFTGYIADLRITKGYARYLYSFTAPTAAFPLFYQAAATPSTDPYFENTTLLLPGNGTNGAQNNTFLDSSTNAFTITRNGNTTQGTFTPFSKQAGAWGNYFDGTGDYLTVAASANQNFGSSDFTVEFWYYPNGTSRQWFYHASTDYWFGVDYNSTLGLWASSTGASWNLLNADPGGNAISTGIPTLGVWNHIAVGRSGSTWSMWLNGVRVLNVAGVSGSIVSRSAENKVIGAWAGGSQFLVNGYLSNFRVVIGTDLYGVSNTSITVPTSPLTAVSNTQLLTCQSNRFIDNSTNAFAITKNGDVSIQTFSPFPTTASYDASVNGGSGYFDGSGDVLSAASNVAFALGTGDFTVETFAYYTAQSNIDALAVANWDGVTWGSNKWSLHLDHTTARAKVTFWFHNYSSTVPLLTSSSTLAIGQWYHVAVSRSGNTFRLFINGVLDVSATNSTSLDGGTNSPIYVGGGGGGGGSQYFTGYLSSTRLVKGTAVYTATFTTPTAPLTAVSGTSLLLSGTNGGIIDNTMSNNLETVGGASISTTQSKFGGSSIYFDGTGDYLTARYNKSLGLLDNQADFTLEGWFYKTVAGTTQMLLSTFEFSGTYTGWAFQFNSSNFAEFYCYDSANNPQLLTGTVAVSLSTWTHVAVSRYAGVTQLFVNGSNQATRTTAFANTVTESPLIMGMRPGFADQLFTGYMDDVRITSGIARYVQNFTPPTSAFLTL